MCEPMQRHVFWVAVGGRGADVPTSLSSTMCCVDLCIKWDLNWLISWFTLSATKTKINLLGVEIFQFNSNSLLSWLNELEKNRKQKRSAIFCFFFCFSLLCIKMLTGVLIPLKYNMSRNWKLGATALINEWMNLKVSAVSTKALFVVFFLSETSTFF